MKPSKYRYDDRTGMFIPVVSFGERLSRLGGKVLSPFVFLLRWCWAVCRSVLALCVRLAGCCRSACCCVFAPFVKCWSKIKMYYRDEDWLMVGVWLGIGYVLYRVYRFLLLLLIGLCSQGIAKPLGGVWNCLWALAVWLWDALAALAIWLWEWALVLGHWVWVETQQLVHALIAYMAD